MIVIANQRNIHGKGLDEIYIGRAMPSYGLEASPLGNPYKLGRDGGRDEVINKYRRWLWNQMRNRGSAAYRELLRLANLSLQQETVTLSCWCFPSKCHGEIIRDAINFLLSRLMRSYMEAKVAGDEQLAALVAEELLTESRAALDTVLPAFTGDGDGEVPSASLWEPGELAPVTMEDELFTPYVGQLFLYSVWDALDDVDSSLSTIFGRDATIESIAGALSTAAREAARVAIQFHLESIPHFSSGAPREREEPIAPPPVPWIASMTAAFAA